MAIPSSQSSRQRKQRVGGFLSHLLLIVGGCSMILPLIWMISTALKEPADVMSFPPDFIPRRQEMWTDAQGRPWPIFLLQDGGQVLQVARLNTSSGQAQVRIIAPANLAGQVRTVPLLTGPTGKQRDTLQPLKRISLRWRNFPDAWHALSLQDNWGHWEWPWQMRLGPLTIGPYSFAGFPIRNAFLAFYLNSLLVTLLVTFGEVFTSSLAAYAFSRLNFPGRDRLFVGYLGTLMVPAVVTMIPVFILLKVFGWIDTYTALILPPMFSAYGTFLLRQFFVGIPRDLEDAAKLDGCGLWGVYRHVILPLSGPALATLTTFCFLGTWNSFMWPLIVIGSQEKKPLMLGLYAFMGRYSTDWNLLMAASLLVMAPVVIVFLLGQRFFVKGISITGMKG